MSIMWGSGVPCFWCGCGVAKERAKKMTKGGKRGPPGKIYRCSASIRRDNVD